MAYIFQRFFRVINFIVIFIKFFSIFSIVISRVLAVLNSRFSSFLTKYYYFCILYFSRL